jgi:hypothetical protein
MDPQHCYKLLKFVFDNLYFEQRLFPDAIPHGLQAEQLVSGCVDQTRSSGSSSSSTASCWPPVDEVDTPGKSSDSGYVRKM